MEKTEVKTMKLSRTDLIKTCAATLLDEYMDELLAAQKELGRRRSVLRTALQAFVGTRWADLLKTICEETGGRENRMEIRPLYVVRLGEDIPTYAPCVVLDGNDYDCNFRLQFNVPIGGPIRELADRILEQLAAVATLEARSTKVADMDAKARQQLIADALDSTPEGQQALSALTAMRKAL